jgi:hypothetical protein
VARGACRNHHEEISVTETSVEAVVLPPEEMSQFFREAAGGVTAIADELQRIGALFRSADPRPANEALTGLPVELRQFIVLVNVLDTQLRIPAAEITVDDLAPADQLARLGAWLESLVDAQINDDPLTIADILEYDLEPFLRRWQEILSARIAA